LSKYFYYFANIKYKECHPFCTACENNADECSECIHNDGILFEGNKCLCQIYNGFYISATIECMPCHKMCKKCFGSQRDQCEICRNGEVLHSVNVQNALCDCEKGYFYDDSKMTVNEYCQPCVNYCADCKGSANNCIKCKENSGLILFGSQCRCAEYGFYENINLQTKIAECLACNPLCLICTGPLNSQCDLCNEKIGAFNSDFRTCSCKKGFYYDNFINKCEECDPLCESCTISKDNCEECKSNISFEVSNIPGKCVTSCYEFGNYYRKNNKCECIFIELD